DHKSSLVGCLLLEIQDSATGFRGVCEPGSEGFHDLCSGLIRAELDRDVVRGSALKGQLDPGGPVLLENPSDLYAPTAGMNGHTTTVERLKEVVGAGVLHSSVTSRTLDTWTKSLHSRFHVQQVQRQGPRNDANARRFL